jgi:hypothetical protein
MLYGVLADVVVALHFLFVVFVVGGGLLVLRRPWLARVHLPVAAYGALIEFVGFICPLTPMEKWLRRLAGEGGYEGGFIAHYILPVLYPRGLTREVQLALGLIVIGVNAAVYWVVWRRGRRRKRAGPGA